MKQKKERGKVKRPPEDNGDKKGRGKAGGVAFARWVVSHDTTSRERRQRDSWQLSLLRTARRGLGVLMREENVASSERVKRQIETGHIRQVETLPLGGSPWNTGADKGTWAGLSLIMQNGVRALIH